MTQQQAIERLREYADSLDRAPVHDDMGLSMTHTYASDVMRDVADWLAALPVREAPQEAQSLTFAALDAANRSRVVRWHPDGLDSWSPLEWAGAMAGEAGEACNAAKKLKRIADQIQNINTEPGRSLTERAVAAKAIAKEVADTVIYGSLLVAAVSESLEAALVEVFNRKSEEYGFPERLSGSPTTGSGTLKNRDCLGYARILELCDEHGIVDTDMLKHTLEDAERLRLTTGSEPPQDANVWCAEVNRTPDNLALEGCTGKGRPSCTAAECFFGIETCQVCQNPKAIGGECGFVHHTVPSGSEPTPPEGRLVK